MANLGNFSNFSQYYNKIINKKLQIVPFFWFRGRKSELEKLSFLTLFFFYFGLIEGFEPKTCNVKVKEERIKTLGEGCEIKVLNVNIQHLFDHLHLITFFKLIFYYFYYFCFF